MNEITLRGLPSDQFASAMAAFGLYGVLDGCKIRFATDNGIQYFPVIHSEYKSLKDLARFLADRKTWESLGIFPDQKGFYYYNKKGKKAGSTKIAVDDFHELYDEYPALASGMATDAILITKGSESEEEDEEKDDEEEDKDDRTTVGWSPLYCLSKMASLNTEIALLLDVLDEDKIIESLTSERTWAWENSDQTLGLHCQFEVSSSFRNPPSPPKHKKKGVTTKKTSKKRIPIFTLLYLASWRLFTVYPSTQSASAVGFDGLNFYYPISDRLLDAEQFKALLVNPWLRDYRRYKKGFRRMGVQQVFHSTKQGVKKNESPNFSNPISL